MMLKFKFKNWPLSLAVVFLVLGLLLSLQFRTQRLLASSLEAQKTTDLITMWKNLSTKRNQLQGEIAQLQQQLFTLKTNSSQSSETETSMEKELARLQMNTGLAAVKGPGITVTITGDAPLLYYDLVDLVNELWASGAEAIAVNDHRISAYTTISDQQDGPRNYITIDGQRLLYPIVIKAIGDPQTLDKGLTFTGGLIDNLNNLYKIYPIIKKEQDLQLPATSLPSWHYAKPAPPSAPAGDQNGK
ncbi:uncharacterized protein conserved in bacteria [Moorella thermoacetica Y72]|uniref:Division initiation protein n=3 Tax=Neomoorella thermoacetica TaxID=1525 RepID=A0A1J5JKA4_NEOTH|nr:hypothetical protein MOOR_13150 [Moorella thermoacetica]OIQ10562.1 hypothetical protein MOOTH_25320 [Moorella thermoacetica]OIQ53231.1 hypothetical protein MORE_22620 [Moorella thermoacetica]GAF25468.1 uncharacterized protein conserved in bacteria [Moorella thermoacetica Y72]